MLHFMKSAPSQGQVNSPTAQPGPTCPSTKAAAELGLPSLRTAYETEVLGEGDAGAQSLPFNLTPSSLSCPAAPCPTLWPVLGLGPAGNGPV